MARRVHVVEDQAGSPKIGWDQWTDGGWWELDAGVDFHQAPRLAGRAARQWASNHGFHCSARQLDNGNIQVKFTKVDI